MMNRTLQTTRWKSPRGIRNSLVELISYILFSYFLTYQIQAKKRKIEKLNLLSCCAIQFVV